MKERKYWKLIFLVPILLAVMYVGGYIAQFFRNYDRWMSTGSTGAPVFPSYLPGACLEALFTFPYGLKGVILCIVLLAILILFLLHRNDDGEVKDKERNLSYSNKGTYGTAGFMTEAEMGEVLELADSRKTDGTILGKLNGKAVCLPLKSRMNRNIAVFGASGSMKSRAFARNMIFQTVRRGESLIVTDPKSGATRS